MPFARPARVVDLRRHAHHTLNPKSWIIGVAEWAINQKSGLRRRRIDIRNRLISLSDIDRVLFQARLCSERSRAPEWLDCLWYTSQCVPLTFTLPNMLHRACCGCARMHTLEASWSRPSPKFEPSVPFHMPRRRSAIRVHQKWLIATTIILSSPEKQSSELYAPFRNLSL